MSQAENESPIIAEGACPFAQQYYAPQFGIIHLMILTAVTAVLLKLNLAMDGAWTTQIDTAHLWLRRVGNAMFAVMFAAELVAAGILLRAGALAMAARLQPGHWILLISALQGLLGRISWLFYLVIGLEPAVPDIMVWVTLAVSTLEGLVTGMVCLYALRRLRDARRWKVWLGFWAFGALGRAGMGMLFGLFSVLSSGSGASPPYQYWRAMEWFATVWMPLMLFVFVCVVVADFGSRRNRDWLHWLGVLLTITGLILATGWRLVWTFWPPTAWSP